MRGITIPPNIGKRSMASPQSRFVANAGIDQRLVAGGDQIHDNVIPSGQWSEKDLKELRDNGINWLDVLLGVVTGSLIAGMIFATFF